MKFQQFTLGAVALGLAAATGAAHADITVKLGHVAPLSGGQAHLGKDNEAAARLGVEDLNRKGIVIDGQKVKFVLLSEDDAADPRQATAVAQKLVDAGVVAIIGHLNSGTSIPASRIYSEAGIPQIAVATNPKYTQQGYKTTFRDVTNDAQIGQRLGEYSVRELKGKSIAIVDDRTAYGQGLADEFANGVKAAGGTVAVREFTTDKSTEFGAILTKIKGFKPDVLFYGGMDPQGGPLIRQARQLGINAKVLGGDGICTTELAKLAGDGLVDNSVLCAEPGGAVGEYKKSLDAFRAMFRERTGAEVQVYAPYIYDSTMLIGDAIARAQSADPEKFLPYVAKAEYKGVTGLISFDARGDIRNGALTLNTFRGGRKTELAVIR